MASVVGVAHGMARSRRSVVQFIVAAALVLVLGACAQEPTAPAGEPVGVIAQPLAAGYYHNCGLTGSGAAYCWGWNLDGALGIGSITPDFFRVPVAVSGGMSFTAITANVGHTCALTSSGAAYCWGFRFGDGLITNSSIPVAVSGGVRFTTIAAGESHTCALTRSGAAYCWGFNHYGQLGDGSTTHRPTPVAVSGGLSFTTIAAGANHTCALTRSGAAYCWGSGGSIPVAVSGELTFTTLTAGEGHTCGLTSSGSAYCWGRNATGQLGDGSTTSRSSPVAVAGGLSFSALAAGSGLDGRAHTCALTSSGAAYCWGADGLGASTRDLCGPPHDPEEIACNRTPVAVSGGLTFSTLVVGSFHTCGLTAAGSAYCWGGNGWGQLGTGSTENSFVPVAVAGGLSFGDFAADPNRTCRELRSGCKTRTPARDR